LIQKLDSPPFVLRRERLEDAVFMGSYLCHLDAHLRCEQPEDKLRRKMLILGNRRQTESLRSLQTRLYYPTPLSCQVEPSIAQDKYRFQIRKPNRS
jgi:hypothetical protein